jgi:Fe-S cluster assembly protein SufD
MIMQAEEKNIQWYQSQFTAFEQGLNGEKSTDIHRFRRAAIQQLLDKGFPTTRQEEWRFTNVAPILKNMFVPVTKTNAPVVSHKYLQPHIIEGASRLVFVNGSFSKELSDISNLDPRVVAGSLYEKILHQSSNPKQVMTRLIQGKENGFTALNSAFLWDGAFISIPRYVELQQPIQIIHITTDSAETLAVQPRNVYFAGEKSEGKILESYIGLGKNIYLSNSVTEILLEDQAVVEHDQLQIEGENAFHIGTTRVQMQSASTYVSNIVSLGGSLVRSEITAELAAKGIECTLNGLSIGSGKQLIDNHTTIDHANPNCNSHELYKAILGGASKGVFNGKIFVRKDAQKTDAKQTNKTLLLTDDATINAKPQLEIFADDVKCTHGATVGQLDENQIFYLRSRGIDEKSARDILTTAFAEDVVNRITVEPFRQIVEHLIQKKLEANRI